jgi:hypothetical protein
MEYEHDAVQKQLEELKRQKEVAKEKRQNKNRKARHLADVVADPEETFWTLSAQRPANLSATKAGDRSHMLRVAKKEMYLQQPQWRMGLYD